MSVRRKYSLPGCTLILEGVTTDTGERRPTISAVVNAECHILGQGRILSGGQGFLRQLVESLSAYSQSLLSGITPVIPDGYITIEPIDTLEHRLTISDPGLEEPVSLELTTLQLFDLLESLDQMLADVRTLPDWSLDLQPLTRHQARLDPPIAERATPVAIGATGLAVAALSLFFLPVPEVRRPEESVPLTTEATTTEDENGTGSAPPDDDESESLVSVEDDDTELEAIDADDDEMDDTEEDDTTADLEDESDDADADTDDDESDDEADDDESEDDAPDLDDREAEPISDSDRLYALSLKLDSDLSDSWETGTEPDYDREYRVSVGNDGAIVGYISTDGAAEDYLDATPLPDLLYVPTDADRTDVEAQAEFRVVFSNTGSVEVSPWDGYDGEPSAPPSLTDEEIVEARFVDLIDRLYDELPNELRFDRALAYRLGVTEDGTLAQVESLTGDASAFYGETPLPDLYEPDAALAVDDDGVRLAPLVEFRVVFQPGGTIEIAPWYGLP